MLQKERFPAWCNVGFVSRDLIGGEHECNLSPSIAPERPPGSLSVGNRHPNVKYHIYAAVSGLPTDCLSVATSRLNSRNC